MTRKELAAVLIEKAGLEAGKIDEFVDQVFEIMKEALERGEKIKIPGFGVFKVRAKAARKGRNPKSGERMEISARRVVSFKPSPVLRQTLNREGK
jgi:integration host factor subunit alpha